MVARAELNNVRSVSHCRDLVQLPVAACQRIRDGQARIGGSGGCRRRPGPAQWPCSGPLWANYPAIRVGLRAPRRPTSGPPPAHGARSRRLGRTCHRAPKSHADCHGWRRWPASAPEARRHATLLQSRIQRENWEFETHSLLRVQKQLVKQDLLIVDELGYVPLSKTGAELLFEIFSQRYEQASTLVTSNLPFNEWTEIFGSERLTGALLDRLTHHVHILELNGESYRLEHSKKARPPAAAPAS